MQLNRLSFRQKLWLPLVFSLIALTLLSVFNAYQTREIRMEERKNNLVSVTTEAFSIIKQYGDLAHSGSMSAEEARTQALDRIRALRYDKDGYFTITSSQEVVIMHPIAPDLNGKKRTDFKDAQGNALYVDITNAGKQSDPYEVDGWRKVFACKVFRDRTTGWHCTCEARTAMNSPCTPGNACWRPAFRSWTGAASSQD